MPQVTLKQMEAFSEALHELYGTVSLENLGQDFIRVFEALVPADRIATNYFEGTEGVQKVVSNLEYPREVSLDFFRENQLQNPCIPMCLNVHLDQVYRQAATRAEIQEAMEIRELAAGHALTLVLSETGLILFSTEETQRLCTRYFLEGSKGVAPRSILAWLASAAEGAHLTVTRGDLKLAVKYVGKAPHRHCGTIPLHPDGRIRTLYLLRLVESPVLPSSQPLQRLGLTPREAEILLWVTEGKSNREIAIILGSKEGTVRKHLEHIHQKLGVDNRMQAALVAREVL